MKIFTAILISAVWWPAAPLRALTFYPGVSAADYQNTLIAAGIDASDIPVGELQKE